MRETALALPAADAPLDEVMLAMDVVDTLRHEQALVDAELGAEAREQALVERLKALYAGQGIEVSAAVIAQGVSALKAERFVYRPPPPGFAVRLARLWIARGRIVLGAVLLAGLAGLGVAVDHGFDAYRAGRAEAAAHAANAARQRAIAADARAIAEVRAALALLADADATPLQEAFDVHRDAASSRLDAADRALAATREAVDRGAPSAVAADATAAAASVDVARREIERAQAVIDLARRVRGLRERAAAADLDAEAQSVVGAGFAALDAAVASVDAPAAAAAAQRVEQDLSRAELAYTLRIVSRAGERSGVWRRARGRDGARNHYLIVEAVDAAGRVLALPVENEETQRTEMVERFGIRVPEAVYARVRADREDNGLVDAREVGAKRRGTLAPTWSIETAGGAITRW
jgi:hypothetical protein